MHLPSSDRRSLFRQAFGGALEHVARATEARIVQHRYVRPPGALPEIGFLATCTRCGACAAVCPVGAILHVPSQGGLAAGTPFLEPGRIPCIACPDIPAPRPADEALTVRRGRRPSGWARSSSTPSAVPRLVGVALHGACPDGDAALAP